MKKVTINGKFLTRPLSGVQRTAYEVVLAIDQLLDNGQIDPKEYEFTVLFADKIVNPIHLKHVRLVKKGILSGNLWEQFELPVYSAGTTLLSMCSISTVFKRNQIVIIHDASFLVNKHFFAASFRLWYSFAIPLLGKVSARIVTVSLFSKNELVRYARIKSSKISVISNSPEHILRAPSVDDAFVEKINALKPYCLAVSNLAANKNFKRLSDAISKIDFKNYRMLIAGGAMDTLQHVAPDNTAEYLGYVTDAELKHLYANASVFLFPSIYEGFGIPPLEAMILGCPVAASNTSSMPEVLGSACAYFNPLDVSDMAGQINQLINNPQEQERLRALGYDQAKKYSWHKSALQLVKLIK